MGRSLQHYLVSQQTQSLSYCACAGSERLLVFATSLPRGTADMGAAHSAASSICAMALRNTSDDLSQLDMAVRRFDPSPSSRFSEARVSALLPGANRQLRESLPGTESSAVLLTTWFGSLFLAQAGSDVALHRLRRGKPQLLTTHVLSRDLPGGVEAAPFALGHRDELHGLERHEALEEGDVFVLSRWSRDDAVRTRETAIFEQMARAPSFDSALGLCFRSRARPYDVPLLLAHCA